MTEKIARERRNQADKIKKKHYENTKEQVATQPSYCRIDQINNQAHRHLPGAGAA